MRLSTFLTLSLAPLLSAACASASPTTKPCPTVPAAITVPDQLVGVRTKFGFEAGRDARHTIHPDLEGLPLLQWTHLLEAQGVNTVDLNLEPSNVLQPGAGAPADADVIAYADAAFRDPAQQTAADHTLIARFHDHVIPEHTYSMKQQIYILLRFLQAYQHLYDQSLIDGKLKFLVHQRIWYRPGNSPRQVAQRLERVDQFSADMAALITTLQAAGCLDQWLTGIRQGEDGNPDMDEFLPVVAGLAAGINSRTHGWMSHHLFVANGGGMGAEFLGLDDYERSGKGVTKFLEAMRRNSAAFAFGYKWFRREDISPNGQKVDPKKAGEIKTQFLQATCGPAPEHPCQDASVDDWKFFLAQTLGFSQLVSVFRRLHPQFPLYANVIFVGDSGDGIYNLTTPRDSALVPDPAFLAIQSLWPHAPGWCGKQYLNGFVDIPTAGPNAERRGTEDNGLALYFIHSADSVVPETNTIRLWRSFPSCASH